MTAHIGRNSHPHPAALDPFDLGALSVGPKVLAVITAIEGPAYRRLGDAMLIGANGQIAGALSSGCIDADVCLHAQDILQGGAPRRLRYGAGSPFMDIRLPCGGALEVTLTRDPGHDFFAALSLARKARNPVSIRIAPDGQLALAGAATATGWQDGDFVIALAPRLRFLIFGNGAEPLVFAGLLHSLDHDHILLSHDADTLSRAHVAGISVRHITGPIPPDDIKVDAQTAVTLFYHEHDREVPVLARLLDSPAFYIGAQGSRRVAEGRAVALQEAGCPSEAIKRLCRPFGLIPSARDPKLLAVSVLADVLAQDRSAHG